MTLLILGLAPGAAAQGCAPEAEPNDAPEQAIAIGAPGCLSGALPEDDLADVALWTIGPEQGTQRWEVSFGSPDGMAARLTISRVSSDPAASAMTLDPTLVELRTEPGSAVPVVREDLFLRPGRYVAAVSPGAPWSGDPTTWRLDLAAGTPFPALADMEPNDDPGSAIPVGGAFELGGDAAGTDDHLAWQVGDAMATGLWTLEAQVPIGTSLALSVTDAEGVVVGDARSQPDGIARLPDLRLAPGIHTIRVVGIPEPSAPYILRAHQEALPFADAEPNDVPARALPIAPGDLMAGRLARPGDWDSYRLTVDEAMANALLDARLIVQTGPPRRLCLYRLLAIDGGFEEAQALSCDEGPDGVTLDSLLLTPGDYQLVVAGTESLVDPYYLRVDTSVAPVAGYELEPNDMPALATPMRADETMRGRLDNSDHVRVRIEDGPQLWQVEARGPDARLTWVRTDGQVQGIGSDPDGTRQRSIITDAYLIPGDHWFRVDGSGEYTLSLEPLGPPIPGGEREPNEILGMADRLPMDGSVTGRLATAPDTDHFRFSLAAPEHVAITLEPPPGVAMSLYPEGDTRELVSPRHSSGSGEAILLDVVLPAGDHAFRVGGPPGPERYRLSLERADPFLLADDQEPNDRPEQARPMPASLAATGTLEPGDVGDWYTLEPLPAAGELVLRTAGVVRSIEIDDGSARTPLTPDAEASTWRSPSLPAGARIAIGVTGEGDYEVAVDPGTTGLVGADGPSPELPVDLALSVDATEVAAFEMAGQRVDGRLALTNRGEQALDLRLDAITSHPDWSVELEAAEVTLAPGASAEVPVAIVVPAQAWAETTVRATIRARAGDVQGTAFTEITPRAGLPLIGPMRWWGVPPELLGGIDAAATGHGAVPLVSVDPVGEPLLHDGVVALGTGMDAALALPQTLGVDLAGDEPVPVTGMMLDPTAGPGVVAGTVRAFELLLSMDGATWEPALSGELSGALAEQAFVLPEPVPARFAQLRVISRFPGSSQLRLGEWKVVAAPGWQPTSEALDIAVPAIGGHIAWLDPQPGSPDMLDRMLVHDADPPQLLGFDPRVTGRIEWAIGFQDGRAAQVSELRWSDSAATRPELRLRRVELAGSMDGPLGPWTPLGTWRLERDAAGAVSPFTLETPTWVRYLRMSAPVPDSAGSVVELPNAIDVLERPPSDDYRTMTGEWGYAASVGPFEWQQPPDTVASGCTVEPVAPSGDRSLAPGLEASGCVARGVRADAYAFTVPEGQRSIRLTVSGRRSVGVGVTLLDEEGAEVPTAISRSERPGAIDHVAEVTPGARYRLLVEQPPSSVILVYDTSGSVGPFIPLMSAGLRSYVAGMVSGEETVQLVDLEAEPIPEEPTDDPWLILAALEAHAGSWTGSSSAEIGLIEALDALASREGARAIFLMTDAETGSFSRHTELWRWLELVQPRIFTLQVGGCCVPRVDERFMQDWAAVGDGYYDHARTGGDIEPALERMATWLRRPADYRLSIGFAPDPPPEPEPGRLRVASDPDAPSDEGEEGDARAARTAADVAVEIVLDTSGSMLERLGRRRRIDVARDVLGRLVAEQLEPGVPVALRVFRQERDSCETDLAVPLGPLDPAAMAATIDALRVGRTVRTPLAKAIAAVGDDLAAVTGPRVVIVVSDGQESCDGDPEAAVQDLTDAGFDVTLNVVGLDLDRSSRRRISRLARVGGGAYYDARDAAGLAEALKGALGAPYVVLDAQGVEVARGTVDGPALELPPGTYRVTLAGATAALDAVVIESGGDETVVTPEVSAS